MAKIALHEIKMAAEGDVVFNRDQEENDSDIWDDTALVQAYDRAVQAMKVALEAEEEEDTKEQECESITNETDDKTEETDNKTEDTDDKVEGNDEKTTGTDDKAEDNKAVEAEVVSSSSTVKKKTKKKGKPKGHPRWTPGDKCIAMYSEDQLWYKAEILSINPQRRTCLVRYTDYGNEEEQNLRDLSTLDQEGEFLQMHNGAAEGSSYKTPWRQYRTSEASGTSRYESWWRDYYKNYGSYPPLSQAHLPPPPSGQAHGSQAPPPPPFPWAGNMPGFPMWPPRPGRQDKLPPPPSVQKMPPLPPPPAVTDGLEDDDSLACMLMAWYMSGYHTGYYQGLKDAKTGARSSRLGSQSPGSTGSRPTSNAGRWGWE